MTGPDAPVRSASRRSSGDERSEAGHPSSRSVRSRVRALPGGALGWRIGVTVVGVAVVVAGVVLLPLPGPGWLIIFGGLGVLATEYEWARRLLAWTRVQVRRWTSWLAAQPRWVQAVAGVVVAGCVALAAWWLLIR